MSKKVGTKETPKLDAGRFGDFSHGAFGEMLKEWRGSKSESAVVMAATFLASAHPSGPNPGNELVALALDVLKEAGTSLASDLIWQAAEQAQNSRIRAEAIKRCAIAATTERLPLLRKWALEGFQPRTHFQYDHYSPEMAQAAAIKAMGELSKPTDEEVQTLLQLLGQPRRADKFSPTLFTEAANAYWSIGTRQSLPKLVTLLSEANWHADMGLVLTSLVGKFAETEIRPHEKEVWQAFRNHARQWREEEPVASRLIDLAQKLASPERLREWAENFGDDPLEHGRGKVFTAMLSRLDPTSEGVVNALLVLSRWPRHAQGDGPVTRGIRTAVKSGHGGLIAKTIVGQQHQGYLQMVESGLLFALWEEYGEGVTAVCEALSDRRDGDHRQRVARVANGLMVSASFQNEDSLLTQEMMQKRGTRYEDEDDRREVRKAVKAILQGEDAYNPFRIVSRLACLTTPNAGAVAVIESWLRMEEPVFAAALRAMLQEAGRSIGEGNLQSLRWFENVVFEPRQQQLQNTIGSTFVAESQADGSVNRYAMDVMQRRQLNAASAAEKALNGLKTVDDAAFVLRKLRELGEDGIGVLELATQFHHSDAKITQFVQSQAIRYSTDFMTTQRPEQRRRVAFASRLHERFFDLAPVRQAAYQACGDPGDFSSIKALRERLKQETVSELKTAIGNALASLKGKLETQKPDRSKPDDIVRWLDYLGELGDPTLLASASGYLNPPHADHKVRHAALKAIQNMGSPDGLAVVKQFISDTAPHGETLSIARRARLMLENRRDVDLFDVLSQFFPRDAEVLDPALDYEALLTPPLLSSVTKRLREAQQQWEACHWDDFVTKVNAVMEALIKRLLRAKPSVFGLDAANAEKRAQAQYGNIVNMSEFQKAFGTLQSRCQLIHSFRRESPTAHALNTDGSEKPDTTEDDAEAVRDAFIPAFGEVVKALQ